MSEIYRFPDQGKSGAADLHRSMNSEDPAVKAKLEELQSWTLCYNREVLRINRELNELRSKISKAA
jgi:hypothetical protein